MAPTKPDENSPTTEDAAVDEARKVAGVATLEDNAKLEHTAGGATTRDGMDAGAPMLPGDKAEPIGPEDPLGVGPTRGDYSDRLVTGPALVPERIPPAERGKGTPIHGADGKTVIGHEPGPASRLVPAAVRAEDVADVAGKGGVSTEAARKAAELEARRQ